MSSTATEERVLLSALKIIKEEGELSDEIWGELSKVFGTRFENAVKAVEEGKVRRVTFTPSRREVWIVSGKERNYLLLQAAGYCSCEDFYFRVISHEEILCYHLLAQRLADALCKYTVTEEPDIRYEEVASKVAKESEEPRKLPMEAVENVRRLVAAVLVEEQRLPLGRILELIREAGFPDLTSRHLVVILVTDKARRFRSLDGEWELVRSRS
jgi:predicted nucleic acid-binding Zn finger protein